MKLVDLDPMFCGAGGPGVTRDAQPVPERSGVGLACMCPCGCDRRMYVAFENPIDGGEAYTSAGEPAWTRTGESYEALTLRPSIQRADPDGCSWHGFLTDGVFRAC